MSSKRDCGHIRTYVYNSDICYDVFHCDKDLNVVSFMPSIVVAYCCINAFSAKVRMI